MDKKFTPGPWKFGKGHYDERLILGGENERYVANVQIYQTPRYMGAVFEDQRIANAYLIKAAPDLYAELDRVVELMKSNIRPLQNTLDRIEKVLSKARGE